MSSPRKQGPTGRPPQYGSLQQAQIGGGVGPRFRGDDNEIPKLHVGRVAADASHRIFLSPARAPKIAPMTPEEIRILRAMTPEQKLRAIDRLYWTARSLKAAWLRQQHPDWREDEIQREVRAIFMNART